MEVMMAGGIGKVVSSGWVTELVVALVFIAWSGLLFVAELGDKTQLAVLGLTSKQPTAWGVFAGGALALVTATALGVLGGEQLRRVIPERVLLRISAVAFVAMGVLMGVGIL